MGHNKDSAKLPKRHSTAKSPSRSITETSASAQNLDRDAENQRREHDIVNAFLRSEEADQILRLTDRFLQKLSKAKPQPPDVTSKDLLMKFSQCINTPSACNLPQSGQTTDNRNRIKADPIGRYISSEDPWTQFASRTETNSPPTFIEQGLNSLGANLEQHPNAPHTSATEYSALSVSKYRRPQAQTTNRKTHSDERSSVGQSRQTIDPTARTGSITFSDNFSTRFHQESPVTNTTPSSFPPTSVYSSYPSDRRGTLTSLESRLPGTSLPVSSRGSLTSLGPGNDKKRTYAQVAAAMQPPAHIPSSVSSSQASRNQPSYCNDCQMEFLHPWKYRDHMVKHTGEKRFKCETCPHTSFGRARDLQKHFQSRKHAIAKGQERLAKDTPSNDAPRKAHRQSHGYKRLRDREQTREIHETIPGTPIGRSAAFLHHASIESVTTSPGHGGHQAEDTMASWVTDAQKSTQETVVSQTFALHPYLDRIGAQVNPLYSPAQTLYLAEAQGFDSAPSIDGAFEASLYSSSQMNYWSPQPTAGCNPPFSQTTGWLLPNMVPRPEDATISADNPLHAQGLVLEDVFSPDYFQSQQGVDSWLGEPTDEQLQGSQSYDQGEIG